MEWRVGHRRSGLYCAHRQGALHCHQFFEHGAQLCCHWGLPQEWNLLRLAAAHGVIVRFSDAEGSCTEYVARDARAGLAECGPAVLADEEKLVGVTRMRVRQR